MSSVVTQRHCLNVLVKKITYRETNFIKYSCISYKVGWYSHLVGFPEPPEMYLSPLATKFRERWRAGYLERERYIKSTFYKPDSKEHTELLPDFFYVLYGICPRCAGLASLKANPCIYTCDKCGFHFSALTNMPHALSKLHCALHPICIASIDTYGFKKWFRENFKFVKWDLVISVIILLVLAGIVFISSYYNEKY